MAAELLTSTEIIMIIGSLLLAFVLSKIAYFLIEKVLGHIASKTTTTLDDVILEKTKLPLQVLFVLVGLFISLKAFIEGKFYQEAIDKIFFVIITFTVAWFVSRLLSSALKWYADQLVRDKKDAITGQAIPTIRKALVFVVYIIAGIIVLRHFGVEITPILASLGIAGLAVALALQDILSNFFSGIIIGTDKPFKVGDFIRLENGVEGTVEEVGWRSTRIKASQGQFVVVPNRTIAQSVISNFSPRDKELTITQKIGVGYSSEVDDVKAALLEAAKSTIKKIPGTIKVDPVVRFADFGDSALVFTVAIKVEKYEDQAPALDELRTQILASLRKRNIDIPFPTRTIYSAK